MLRGRPVMLGNVLCIVTPHQPINDLTFRLGQRALLDQPILIDVRYEDGFTEWEHTVRANIGATWFDGRIICIVNLPPRLNELCNHARLREGNVIPLP